MFSELHSLAQRTSLTIAIVAEGDKLRIHIQPKPKDEDSPLHPLSLLATPAELDAGFAQAVAVYEPSALSLLEQAHAAASANSKNPATPATTPQAATAKSAKGRPGRKPGGKAADNNSGQAEAGKGAQSGNGEFEPVNNWPFPAPGTGASTPPPAAPAGETGDAQSADQQGDAGASQNESLDLM